MKRFNLSQIMKQAHSLRSFRPEKYPSMSAALKQAWKTAKFRMEMIEDKREETIAFHAQVKKEKQAREERAIRSKTERLAKLESIRHNKPISVEAECQSYGYGRGDHYSAWNGWGNYCGD